MPIEGFDYKGFAENMAAQAKELVPQELQQHEKEYIVKTLGNFTMLAGEALYNDDSLNLTADQAVFITQIIAEWSFHKSIDLVHSGILPQYWDSIMQKIAFTIFEVAKQAIIRQIPQDQLLQAVEHHVIKVYKQSIEELQQKGVIDEATKNRAESQSNIDAMAQEEHAKRQQEMEEKAIQEQQVQEETSVQQQQQVQQEVHRNVSMPTDGVSNKQLKLMSLAMLLKVLSQDKVTTILNKFDSNDSLTISQYMNMADLESRLDGDIFAECLKEMKSYIPVKRKLTKENVLLGLIDLYKKYPRENIEKVIKNERPIIKRFVSQAYDGEYGDLPLKVAGILEEYLVESM